MRLVWILASVCALSACATHTPEPSPALSVSAVVCDTSVVIVSADFPTAAMDSCKVQNDTHITLSIRPEDADINPSPWYSVKLTPRQNTPVTLTLDYANYKHRYFPKISTDKKTWTALPDANLSIADNKHSAEIIVPLNDQPVYLAGQEIIDNADYLVWEKDLDTRSDIRLTEIGHSAQNRPVRMLSTAPGDAKQSIILVGRQHPPEVTGALAMRPFVNTLLADTELARTFRSEFQLFIVSNMNPDGVELGYWRHNTGSTDLNRDWGPFTQPETQAIQRLLDSPDVKAHPPTVFLDFHSTFRNVFYTQPEEAEPTSYDFTGNWLSRSAVRVPDYEFERAERHQTDSPTSKNYMFGRYGIPAITYELSDEADRDLIETSARIFAEEMMKLLLENTDKTKSSEVAALLRSSSF